MDKLRPSQVRKKRIRWLLYTTCSLIVVSFMTFGLYRIKAATPHVDLSTLYPGTVQRGEMVREVRGAGKLVPEDIRWVTSETAGTVERILVEPGMAVRPDTVVVELRSSVLEQQTAGAELDVRAAEADHEHLIVSLRNEQLTQQHAIRTAELDNELAQAEFDSQSLLHSKGLTADNTFNIARVSRVRAEQRLAIEHEKMELVEAANQALLHVSEVRLNQYRGSYVLKSKQLASLAVRAGVAGVLQQVPLDVGQTIAAGANIARVVDPTRLKAELDINEGQMADVRVGQRVRIDLRPGVFDATVARIDPAVSGGIVKVDAVFDGPLPVTVRPDQSVDGLVQIERLDDVLFLRPRPTIGQASSTIGLFVIQGDYAVRRSVHLGRTSANSVEVVEGLQARDRVILSDTSQWDNFDRIRLDQH